MADANNEDREVNRLIGTSSHRRPFDDWINCKAMFADQEKNLHLHMKHLKLFKKAKPCLVWIPYEDFNNIRLIGEGAFAKVYRADLSPKRSGLRWGKEGLSFALKEVDEKILCKEVPLNVHLSSQKARELVPTAYIFGISYNSQSGKYIMVTRCGEQSLDDKRFGTDGTWGAMAQACQILARRLYQIHKHGVIHQDLHPGNVVFMNDGDPVFIDTNLSKIRGQKSQRGVYGRREYLPPEVYESKPYNEYSEVYCLGTLMWQIVTGVPPNGYADKDGLREEPVPGMPKPLADLIHDCWNRNPINRPIPFQVSSRATRAFKAMRSMPISRETREFIARRREAHDNRAENSDGVSRSSSQFYSYNELRQMRSSENS